MYEWDGRDRDRSSVAARMRNKVRSSPEYKPARITRARRLGSGHCIAVVYLAEDSLDKGWYQSHIVPVA